MRARPREINIFNMSLLDILCGALGAFCFMMLVALPYYVTGKVDQARSQKRTEELLKDVEQLREKMSDPAQAEELRKLIDELEAQIKQLQGQLNQYAYENEQLKQEGARLTSENENLRKQLALWEQEKSQLIAEKTKLQQENDRLTKENEINKKSLEMSHPFIVMAGAGDPTQNLALFVEDEKLFGGKEKKAFSNPQFDPRALVQNSLWKGDITNFSAQDRGVTLWVSSTTVPDSTYKIFVKYRQPPVEGNVPFANRNLHPTPVYLTCFGDFADDNRRATVRLTIERFWTLVGTLNIDSAGKMTLKEATEAERDEAWRTLMKSDLPTPAPSATLSAEDMERIRKVSQEERRKFEELRRQRQQPSPAASASPQP